MSFNRDLLAKKLRDPQAKVVADLIQMQQNDAQDTTNTITSNLKGYALKAQDTVEQSDKFYANIQRTNNINKKYYTGKYPDYDNLRLYLLVENGDRLKDYSQMNNEAYAFTDGDIQEIYIREEPNNITRHEIVSYFTHTHYVIVKDHKRFRISDIVVDEPDKEGFTIVRRLNLLKKGTSKQNGIILYQKTDSSSNRYGYSINVDEMGSVYFYVMFDHRQYFCKLNNAFDINTIPANFFSQNFNSKNFRTEEELITKFTEELFDVACSFNFTTKEATIQLRYKNQALLTKSSIGMFPPNLLVNLPMQDGEWSDVEKTKLNTLHDISGNNIDAIVDNLDTHTGYWHPENVLEAKGGNETGTENVSVRASLPLGVPELETLTEFTIAFFYNPCESVFNEFLTVDQRIVSTGAGVPNVFSLRRLANSNDLRFRIEDLNGIQYSVVFPNAFPDRYEWYYVVAKWKSGETLKLHVVNAHHHNNEMILMSKTESDNPVTATITNTTLPITIFHRSQGPNAKIVNFLFFNRQISDIELTNLHHVGPHLAQFPMNKPAQITQSDTPDPITVPFSTLYDLPKITEATIDDYVFLNDPSAANPFVSKYHCPDGVAGIMPIEDVYSIANGVLIAGSDTRESITVSSVDTTAVKLGGTKGSTTEEGIETASLPSTDNSSAIMAKGERRIAAFRIKSIGSGLGQILNEKVPKWIRVWIRGHNTPTGDIYGRIWDASNTLVAEMGTKAASGVTIGDWEQQTFTNNNNTVALGLDFAVGVQWETTSDNDRLDVQRRSGDYDNTVLYYSQKDGSTGWVENSSYELKFEIGYSAATTIPSDMGEKVAAFNIVDTYHWFNPIGYQLNGKALTQATFDLKNENGTAQGVCYCRVWDGNGNVVATLESKNVSELPTTFGPVTFTNFNNTVQMAKNYSIGVEYTPTIPDGETMVVWVRTRDSNLDDTINIKKKKQDDSWYFDSNREMMCTLTWGIYIADREPFYELYSNNYNIIAEKFGTGDPNEWEDITEQTFILKRSPEAITGTLRWRIWKADGTVRKTLGPAINVADISDTEFTAYTFTDHSNTVSVRIGGRIGLEWEGQPLNDPTQKLFAMSNSGNVTAENEYNGTASHITLYDSSGGWAIDENIDLAGTMRRGGAYFDAYYAFSQNVHRIYQKCVNADSSFYNQPLTQIRVRAERVGTIPNPATITGMIRNYNHNIVQVLETHDANTMIPVGSYGDLFFTNPNADYVVGAGDYVAIEISTCDATNFIKLNINHDVVDTGNSVMGYREQGASATDQGQYDLAGTFYIGGQLDFTSKNRIGQHINTQNSRFITTENNRVTELYLTFTKIGDPVGNIFVNIRRGTDDSNIKTLGTIAASSITNDFTVGTTVKVSDLTNSYVLETKDILTVEFNAGDTENKIGVQIRAVTPNYDGTNSYIVTYDGNDYDHLTGHDLVGMIRVGGNTYTPDPSEIPPNMPQSSTDIYIGITNGSRDRGEGMFTPERSIVSTILFTTEILTNLELDNLYKTRIDVESNESDDILVTNYSFIKDV